jgi:hypothetical protein
MTSTKTTPRQTPSRSEKEKSRNRLGFFLPNRGR